MKKLLFVFLVSLSASFAEMVDAIALVVNETPITLYDIEKKKFERKISKELAVSELIDEALFQELVQKYNIKADIFDVNNYLDKLAASNGMDLYTFKSIIKQKYKDYAKYEEQTKQLIIRQKLTNRLVRGNLKIANEEDLKIYYENNQNLFKMAAMVKAVQFSSKNKTALIKAMKDPNADAVEVIKTPVDLDQKNLNPQLRYIINETNNNQFTPIFNANKQFISLLILQKEDEQTIAFESVRDRIFNIVMQDREKKYLKDYFEKLKLSAEIKIVR